MPLPALLLLLPALLHAAEPRQYDVVIAGAGAGGVAAAIQAARLGVSVALLEETDWIGGQMTAAGVSTMDEAGFNTDSGLYAEFTARVRVHYARLGKSIGTCASSPRKTCFEPGVGHAILREMINDVRRTRKATLDLYLRRRIVKVHSEGQRVTGAVTQTGEEFRSRILIDATEYGDVLPLTPARYRLAWFTGDDPAAKGCVQHITYPCVIRKYFNGVPPELQMTIPPPGYTPELVKRFRGQVALMEGQGPGGRPRSFALHNSYRGLPDSANPGDYTREEPEKITKTGVNMANDFPVTLDIFDRARRKRIECQAKLLTLQFLYYVRHELKETAWSIANDEGYDTPYNREENSCPEIPQQFKAVERHFPVMPYVRESIRLIGVRTYAGPQLKRSGDPPVSIFNFPTSIAVGDYPMDLHGCNGDETIEKSLESRADQPSFMAALGPFQVPLQILIPERAEGLMVAEKNLSQSRLVNGATRLQPIAMAVGQAAGAAAALSVRRGVSPRALPPGEVQRALVAAGCRLTNVDYPDVPRMVRFWADIQVVSVHGLMSAVEGQTFAPYRTLTPQAFQQALDRLSPGLKLPALKTLSREDFRRHLQKATGLEPEMGADRGSSISRAEAAAVLAALLGRKDVSRSLDYWPAAR